MAAAAWLALAMGMAQQHAVLHWLSHALAQTTVADKAAAAGNAHCGECDAVTSFSAAAAPATVVGFLLDGVHVRRATVVGAPPVVALRLAYRSRAPPVGRLT